MKVVILAGGFGTRLIRNETAAYKYSYNFT
jgi:GTP:adenosylcobinamide-phosphate guanylyltransferase